MPENLSPTEWLTIAEAAELTGYTASYIRKGDESGLLSGTEAERTQTGGSQRRAVAIVD